MNTHNKLTILLIAYKSEKKIYSFIKKIPKTLKVIIIENSNNILLKKNIEKKYRNIKVFIKKNDGVSSSINFGVKRIKTKYFLQVSPDILFNYEDLNSFFDLAKTLKDKFSAIGPRFLNVKTKSHKQIESNLDIGQINTIHGSFMFINKKRFKEIGGFDDNFFLYFEETDYCKRGKIKNLNSYQINAIKVRQKGRTVNITNKIESKKLSNLLSWHYIWSEFYYHKKYKGFAITVLHFGPLLIRTIFKIIMNKIIMNEKQLQKYLHRLQGLMASIKGQKSYLRL
jgi:hypothetical protein